MNGLFCPTDIGPFNPLQNGPNHPLLTADSFDTFFDAIYWATVSLTTVGYGDIYPITPAGRIITMVSSVFGIAIVALPAGIITAGYMEELNHEDEK